MRTLKIAIQGIEASFHHEAAKQYLKDEFEIVACNTFKNVCDKLATNDIDYAIMAIENSIAGTILSNYSLIKEYGFSVIGEVYLRVSLHLLANKGVELKDITNIESHPMALAQCTEVLSELKNLKVTNSNDTAWCAKNIAETNSLNTAVVASLQAAELYGLNILQRDIEDNKLNFTRFLVIAKHHVNVENINKSTLCFELPDTTGCLAEVLTLVKQNGLNLTKIQSIPVLGKPQQYSFYIDVEWQNISAYEKTITALQNVTSEFSVLGKYKKHELILN